jgi:hypothetical protein
MEYWIPLLVAVPNAILAALQIYQWYRDHRKAPEKTEKIETREVESADKTTTR